MSESHAVLIAELSKMREGVRKILMELDTADWRNDDTYEGPDREELVESVEMKLQALL